MNTYFKYAPNVFVAKCSEKHIKGETILLTTKYGKEHECIVHNFVYCIKIKEELFYCYSIIRSDGYNNQERARLKAEKIASWAESAKLKSDKYWDAAKEGKDFLALAEPIKVGHHSEKRHRALIERNHNRMDKAMAEGLKEKFHLAKLDYWKELESKIDLSMPESLEFFKMQLEDAKELHLGLKNGTIEKSHSFSLTYAKKKCNDLEKKVSLATKLWA